MLASVTTISAAAVSTTLNLTGSITPAACDIKVTPNTATFQLTTGNLDPNNFSKPVSAQNLGLQITCTPSASIALQIKDNQSSTIVPGLMAFMNSGLTDDNAYGLGLTPDNGKIGVYWLVLDQQGGFKGDGNAIRVLKSTNNGGTWQDASVGFTSNKEIYAFGDVTATRKAYSTVTGNINIYPAFNKLSAIPMKGPVSLQGSATLQVLYQ